MHIILGSTSPRREEILNFFSLPFTKVPSQFDEETVIFAGDPETYVKTLASKKAETLSYQYPEEIILTADTTVFCRGKIYNKPQSKEEAITFLEELSGLQHSVFTGVSLYFQNRTETICEETKIYFKELTRKQIEQYLNCINFLDKAGGYAIQQSGSILVKKIEGSYYNVMGLPLDPLERLLKLVNIDLWSLLKLL